MITVYIQSYSSHIIYFDAVFGKNYPLILYVMTLILLLHCVRERDFVPLHKVKIFLCLITTLNFKHKNFLPCFVRYYFSSNPLLFLFISVKAFLLNLHGIHCTFSTCVHNFLTFSRVKPEIMFFWLSEFL